VECCKFVATPTEIRQKFIPSSSFLLRNDNLNNHLSTFPYKQAIGTLVFAMTCTRPDLCYVVMRIPQHLQNPSPIH